MSDDDWMPPEPENWPRLNRDSKKRGKDFRRRRDYKRNDYSDNKNQPDPFSCATSLLASGVVLALFFAWLVWG